MNYYRIETDTDGVLIYAQHADSWSMWVPGQKCYTFPGPIPHSYFLGARDISREEAAWVLRWELPDDVELTTSQELLSASPPG